MIFINVDKNKFFINLFIKGKNTFCGTKCLRCDEFVPSTRFKVVHDFFVHYGTGKNVFEEKPLVYTYIGEIQKYKMTFSEHTTYYNFYNSEKLVDNFLLNVKNCVKRSSPGKFIIKCGFSLENVQLSPFENEELIVNSHYWSTEPYQTKSVNDYIYFSLRKGILKRVINNGMTGSSWHFN